MTDAPLSLDDADFTEDAPPGYRSEQHRQQYLPLMSTLLVITFLAQMVLPFALMIAAMPLFAFRTPTALGMPQYGKLAAWQGAFWYPELAGNGCQLKAIDDRGKPLDRPAIDLDMQPEWLLAAGDRLWAISKNQVAEIFADGTRPVVMYPRLYLSMSSIPFVDRDAPAVVCLENADFVLYRFRDGEWQREATLNVPNFSTPNAASSETAAAEDSPVDALEPENQAETEQTHVNFAVVQNGVLITSTQNAFPLNPGGTANQVEHMIQLAVIGGEVHVVRAENGILYHHVGLPIRDDEHLEPDKSEWTKFDIGPPAYCLGDMEGELILLCQTGTSQTELELRRFHEGQWTQPVRHVSRLSPYQTKLQTVTDPQTKQTFAVVESQFGTSHDLYELHSDRIEKVAHLTGVTVFANPATSAFLWMYGIAYAAPYAAMLLMVLIATWIMYTHREPDYFKGRIAVKYASLLRRFLASLFDLVICVGPPLVGLWLWYQAWTEDGTWMQEFEADPNTVFLEAAPILLAAAGWAGLYYLINGLTLAWYGFTLGKLLCGVRVMRTTLEPPGLGSALIRQLIWPIETILFYAIIAFSLITLTHNRQRLADLIARCVVLHAGSLRKAKSAPAVADS